MAATPLPASDVEARLAELPGWAVVEGRLHRELVFVDFNEAFGFMTRLALVAERMDHHPDWSNSWNRVIVDVVSHAAGGITERCLELAAAASRLAGR